VNRPATGNDDIIAALEADCAHLDTDAYYGYPFND